MWYEELETAAIVRRSWSKEERKNLYNAKLHAAKCNVINCRSSWFNLPPIPSNLSFNCTELSHTWKYTTKSRAQLKQKPHTECAQNSPSNVCFSTCMYCELSRYICNCSFLRLYVYLVFPSHKVNDDDDACMIQWQIFRFNDSVTHFLKHLMKL